MHDRAHERVDAGAEALAGVALLVRALLPRGLLVAALAEVRASGVGQLERATGLALSRDAVDQPLVLELLQRRVHRAGARAPATVAALFQAPHQLVAVQRALE